MQMKIICGFSTFSGQLASCSLPFKIKGRAGERGGEGVEVTYVPTPLLSNFLSTFTELYITGEHPFRAPDLVDFDLAYASCMRSQIDRTRLFGCLLSLVRLTSIG